MQTISKKIVAGIILVLFGAACWASAQNTSPGAQENPPNPTPEGAQATAPAGPDHAAAYYHYMLARRYKELAGIYNRGDYVERAISEYKLAMQADPDSLFLRVELADLYWRISRVGDAVKETEEVLKINPNQVDAHRLLGRIYLRSLGETQPDAAAKDTLHKAIQEYETLTRLDPSDMESYLVLGRLYKLDNKPDKAQEAFQKVLATDPSSRDAVANLAQLYSDQGNYKQSIEVLKKIPDSAMDAPLLGMLAYAYDKAHDVDDSLATFEKALAMDPENQDIRRAYAETLISNGRIEAAQVELQKILKDDPDDGPSHLRVAQLDRETGRLDEAQQELDRAKTLMPDSPELAYEQAQLDDATGNEDKAIALLKGLVESTANADGHYTAGEANNREIFFERLGSIYQSEEKYDQALSEYRQILTLGDAEAPRGETLIIQALRLNHEPQQALQEANAAVQKYPENQALKRVQAGLIGEQGHPDEAVQELEKMLNNTPKDIETYMTIAQVYSQAKRYPEAETAVRKAIALAPKPEDQEMARFMLGSVLEREKKFDEAEVEFKQVLAIDPLNAAAANYLGYMLADRGVRLEESVGYIKKALQLEPNNGAYLDSLGWAYLKMDRPDLAETPLERAGRLITNDPTVEEHLGHLYLKLGKDNQAQQEWERALKEWPNAVDSDFDASQAAKLQKELDQLKIRIAKEKGNGTPGARP